MRHTARQARALSALSAFAKLFELRSCFCFNIALHMVGDGQADQQEKPGASVLDGTASKHELVRRSTKANNIVTEYTSESDIQGVKFSMQGDETMYTAEAMEQRFKNRTHPKVVATIDELWWRAANYEDLAENQNASLEASAHWQISKPEYVRMVTRQIRALLEEGEEWNEQEALELAEESWKSDARGHDFLSKSRFTDCVFELAGALASICPLPSRCSLSSYSSCSLYGPYSDTYTLTTDPLEYVEFLKSLFECVAEGEPPRWVPQDSVGHHGASGDGDNESPSSSYQPSSMPRVGKEEREIRREAQKQRRAAVTLQCSIRGRQGKKQHQEKRQAVTTISKNARMKPKRVDFCVKKDMAVQIQAAARGKPPREHLGHAREQTTKIQAWIRGRLVRAAMAFMLPSKGSQLPAKRVLPPIRRDRPEPVRPYQPPETHQASRYMQPKARPPSKLMDRQRLAGQLYDGPRAPIDLLSPGSRLELFPGKKLGAPIDLPIQLPRSSTSFPAEPWLTPPMQGSPSAGGWPPATPAELKNVQPIQWSYGPPPQYHGRSPRYPVALPPTIPELMAEGHEALSPRRSELPWQWAGEPGPAACVFPKTRGGSYEMAPPGEARVYANGLPVRYNALPVKQMRAIRKAHVKANAAMSPRKKRDENSPRSVVVRLGPHLLRV